MGCGMIGLARAVKLERWDLVWLYLVLGVVEAASKLPRESLDELIGLLAAEEDFQEGGGHRER